MKEALSAHFTLLDAYAAVVRKTFSPAECSYLFLACDGHDPSAQTLAAHALALSKRDDALAKVARGLSVDTGKLCGKLGAAEPGVIAALIDGLAKLRVVFFDGHRHFDGNGLPHRDALRRCGLMEVPGPTAWGLCLAITESGAPVEFVLRYDVAGMPPKQEDEPKPEDLGSYVLQCAEGILRGEVPDGDMEGHFYAYQIAHALGLRRFRVMDRTKFGDEDPEIVELNPSDIAHDIRVRDMAPLWLEGVNAPEPSRSASARRT